METYTIDKNDIAEDGYYFGEADLSLFEGNVHAHTDLGRIKFRRSIRILGEMILPERTGLQVDGEIDVSGSLIVGCGIIAMEDIFSGETISANSGVQSLNGKIMARGSIRAGRSIIAGHQIVSAEGNLVSGENIFAGRFIDVACDITSGRSISANEQIRCFKTLSATRGITAGLYIDCKTLSCDLRVMAGLCRYRLPNPEETEVRFEELVKGDIAFGRAVQKMNSSA